MKILIVGNGNSTFIVNFSKRIRKKNDVDSVSLLTKRKVWDNNKHIYDTIFSVENSRFGRIPVIRKLYKYLYYKKIVSTHEYDVAHFHYINDDALYLSNIIQSNKTIYTIWGSDYYRSTEKQKKKLATLATVATYVTFANEITKNDFRNELGINNNNNLRICRFGLEPLENLKKSNTPKNEAKKTLQWNPSKIAITVGYNANPGQQHSKIIQELKPLRHLRDQIQLIFPLTYSGDRRYKKKLLRIIDNIPFECHIYDKYMSEEDVALIRSASDIMIQLQITDQFSGSMLEYLYTRNVVITGDWLPYSILQKKGISFLSVHNVHELGEKLTKVVLDYPTYFNKTNHNPSKVYELGSWNYVMDDWTALYHNESMKK